MSWEDKKEWEEERRYHDGYCNCEGCHIRHKRTHIVVENALDYPQDFKCCVEEYERMKEEGRVCKEHPRAYFEPATGTTPAFCEQCDLSKI